MRLRKLLFLTWSVSYGYGTEKSLADVLNRFDRERYEISVLPLFKYAESTIFRGAGVSSSAAFELLMSEILNDLYCGGRVGKVEKAIVSQYAENEYFGKPCGLLDQSGISLGGINEIDFKDPESPEIRSLAAPEGYTLVITNTGGSHAALTEHYAAIKTEMHDVANCFKKQYLREVAPDEFYAAIPALRKKVSERAILRACHFYEENERVERAVSQKLGNIIINVHIEPDS